MDVIGVLQKSDLLSVAEQAGAHFKRINAHEWRSACPLHNGEDTGAFAVYFDVASGKQKYKCFSDNCGQGDVYDFVMRWKGLDFVGAYRWLGGEDTPANPVEIERIATERAEHAREMAEEKAREYARALADLRSTKAWAAYQKELQENEAARELWRQRGIPDGWQDWWRLGYCSSFPVGTESGRWITPSLTIPVFGPSNQTDDWPVMNIRHRLINPPKPNDKYRPDRPGLQTAPYIANPYTGFDTDPILCVEGEIKTMVTFKTAWHDGSTLQVIGIPGKSHFRMITDILKGHDVYICFDPDADQQAEEAARQVKGKLIRLPMKIDDAILSGDLDARAIEWRMRTARRA